MDLNMSNQMKAEMDVCLWKKKGMMISSNKNKRADVDLEISKDLEKPEEKKIATYKEAVLIGLKDRRKNATDTDIKGPILRMKKHLMELRGFSEDKITLMIEDDDDDEEATGKKMIPTMINIREKLYALVENSCRRDTLFIHIIASGCSDGLILTPDKEHIPDNFFRALLWRASKIGCNLTVVSDCLVEPAAKCPCPVFLTQPEEDPEYVFCYKLTRAQRIDILLNSKARVLTGYYKYLHPSHLSPVDILNFKETESSPLDILKEKLTESSSSLPDSSCVLLTPFPRDPNAPPFATDSSELFLLPPPKGTNQTSYGAFTNSILDVIEETHGQVSNLELARKAMDKLGGQTPGLRCNHHQKALASFVC